MYPLAVDSLTGWPDTIAFLGLVVMITLLAVAGMAAFVEVRKAKLRSGQEESLRQLVQRYERLAETTLDAQQRAAADLAELRSRTTSIEKILSTVQ